MAAKAITSLQKQFRSSSFQWDMRLSLSSSSSFSLTDLSKSQNCAITRALSAPVLTRFFEVREPNTAPKESTRIDLPEPVSPVRTLNPFENNGFFCILYVPKNDLELFINKSKIKWENKNITQKY